MKPILDYAAAKPQRPRVHWPLLVLSLVVPFPLFCALALAAEKHSDPGELVCALVGCDLIGVVLLVLALRRITVIRILCGFVYLIIAPRLFIGGVECIVYILHLHR